VAGTPVLSAFLRSDAIERLSDADVRNYKVGTRTSGSLAKIVRALRIFEETK
jgi:hypothetical protein